MNKSITSPSEFFGCNPGDEKVMIHWDKLLAYYELLATQSRRIKLEHMGLSSEGNKFINLVISSESNIENLEYYRQISMKLADPRDLSDPEIKKLASDGKVICMQNYGLHSNEVGGAQMCPLLVYDLLTAEQGDLYDILQNVIFIMVPCAEPDGEIVFTNWYNSHVGTPSEGGYPPYLRHIYAGHSNNRDALHEMVVESEYLNDLIIRRYMPQAYQDHHHQCPWHDRLSIAPPTNYLKAPVAPLLYRELSYYGSYMARELEEAGRLGVTSGDEKFTAFPPTTFYSIATTHNCAAMLAESADARIASPWYITREQLVGNSHVDPCIQCPSPWHGGNWYLRDIVTQMYLSSVALLKVLARDREQVLRNMAEKALRQTQRGEASAKQAYLISPEQHDKSALHRLLTVVEKQRIDMFTAKTCFTADGRSYPEGTVIVPLAQPKYAAVEGLLGRMSVIESRYSVFKESPDVDSKGDGFYTCYGENMGVEICVANEKLDVPCEPYHPEKWTDRALPLPGSENLSFHTANKLLRDGVSLYRDASGSFYGEPKDDRIKVEPCRIGLLKKSFTANEEEGFTRNLLRRYEFPFRIVMDKELRDGELSDVDVLIIPGDTPETILDGDNYPPTRLPEFHSGLGTSGAKSLVSFVEKGGRLVAWERTIGYVIEKFGLPIEVISEGLSEDEFEFFGSLAIDTEKDKLCMGMPEKTNVYCQHYQVVKIKEGADISIAARLDPENPVYHGKAVGEAYLKGNPCVVRIPYGKGELVLYGFDPKYRLENDAVYKLLFNAMYN